MPQQVVDGDLRFELIADWGSLPPGLRLGQTAVATDSRDRVYLFNRGPRPVIVLDATGTFVAAWDDPRLNDAHGIFIDRHDDLYLPVKNAHVVLKYRADGELLSVLGRRGVPSDTGYDGDYRHLPTRAAGPFNRPTDVAVAPSGDVYVCDGYGNARVHRFTADGALAQSWGEPGKDAAARFHVPHGIWVDPGGRVLVADRENNRIQVFSADGEYLAQWRDLRRPSDIFVDADGLVFVAELDSLVAVLTPDGELLARWPSPTGTGEMRGGHQIWLDSHGDLYIGQNQEGHRILKYRRCVSPKTH